MKNIPLIFFAIAVMGSSSIFAQRGTDHMDYFTVSPGSSYNYAYFNFSAIAQKENNSNYTSLYPIWAPDGNGTKGYGNIQIVNSQNSPCTVYVSCGEDNNSVMADSRLYALDANQNWISLSDDNGSDYSFAARIILGGWSTANLRASMWGDQSKSTCKYPWYGVRISDDKCYFKDETLMPTMYTFNDGQNTTYFINQN